MKRMTVWLISAVLFASTVAQARVPAAAPPRQDDGPIAAGALERSLWDSPGGEPEPAPPPPPPPPPPPSPSDNQDRRPPDTERQAPPGERPGTPAPPAPPHVGLIERLLPLIAERHPQLAERLREMRERSPEEFQRVLADALAVRLEERLGLGEHRPPPAGSRLDGPPAREREWGEAPGEPIRRFREEQRERAIGEQEMGLDREMGELNRRNEELERRSRELSEGFRYLREHGGAGRDTEREGVRREIEKTVEEHFNVRTELRARELRRVEMELDGLREKVERIRQDLERREQARGPIIERRLRQLLGEEREGW